MQNAVCQLFPYEIVQYEFFNRGKTPFPRDFIGPLKREIEAFKWLKLSQSEKEFLQEKCYYLNPVYLDFLEGYRFNPDEVIIEQKGSDLKVKIIGPWYRTILWETPLMAIISQLYYELTGQASKVSKTKAWKHSNDKAMELKKIGIKFSDFGTRRRFSHDFHRDVIESMIEFGQEAFIGTSNVYFASEYDRVPIGTQAHEFYMYHAAKYGFRMANQLGMENWVKVYNGALGTALTDTFTTKAFLNSFDTKYAKLFDGCRQDSGDPIAYIDMIVDHYRYLRIDPNTKTIVFSDGINSIDLVKRIHKHCQKKGIKDAYGIGTWLTNDLSGIKPLNIVIKMTAVAIDNNWVPTVKLSDSITKNTGDKKTIDVCKYMLNIKEK
jgi:nicotinate phosphoribosyltransferase